ncbi:MAG: hypothetical protein FMNOHCHN_02303 [Ignavibacteriaceae bacterium]|nr:hypothetical protein [Ignavibacteriaceae bacterium]
MNRFLNNKVLYLASGMLIILLLILNSARPSATDWRFDFTSGSTLPYGCEIIENNLPYVFPDQRIEYSYKTIYEFPGDTSDSDAAFIFVNDVFEPDEFDADRLLRHLESGGIVFISAFEFSEDFQDKTGISFTPSFQFSQWEYITFVDSGKSTPGNYSVSKFNYPLSSLSGEAEAGNLEIYAKNDLGEPVYFSKIFGKGKLYIHLFPIGFTNYYMTEKDGYDFAYKSFAYLPVSNIVWDEYYKSGRMMVKTPLRFILSEPRLAWAYYILLISAVLFIFLHGRREQRIIPVIKPFINSTLEFYKQTALLRKKGNKDSIVILFDAFSARVISYYRMSGDIFAEENILLIDADNIQSGILYRQIEKDFEAVRKMEKPGDALSGLITKIDNFYKLTGMYAKRRYRI